MKAIRVAAFGGSEVLQFEDIPAPNAGPGEVVVRLHAAGVNPVDAYRRAGAQGYSPELPMTPGMDGAGEVALVGEGVVSVAAGDRVYLVRSRTGTYAELAACRRENVFPLPDSVSFTEGACLGVPYGTAMRAIADRAALAPGESVLVHGASGSVGIACLQIARWFGARIVGTGGTEAGRDLILRHGAELALDHHDERHFDQALEWTGGRGFDVILEMAAETNLGRDLAILAPRGRVVVIGSRGEVPITPRDLMRRDASVLGMSLLNASPDELAGLFERINRGVVDGALAPVVSEAFPLREAARAQERIASGGALGNIVLRIP